MKINRFIPAAGKGTRLLPLTSDTPKALVPINGKPMIEYILERTNSDYIDKTIVNIHHFADKMVNYLHANHPNFIISDESEQLLNTGGGLLKAIETLNDDKLLFVHNVDIDTNLDVISTYKQIMQLQKSLAYLIVSSRQSSRYLLFDKDMLLCGWTNEKTGESIIVDGSNPICKKYAFSGIQFVNPIITDYMNNFKIEKSFEMIPMYLKIAAYQPISGYPISDCYFHDLGKIDNLKINS